ncbi:kinesin-like protein KIF9 [Scleropages formosus]|uniref:kinesin-like protein KIF9 n=1 Tax=Scleropages formosus TaxID=113540 RepID=UPI000878580F|nr:kinesin-like protein KIF9 [Scleropages formosus]
MSVHGSDVKVFVRTRPTAHFATDLIEYLPDGQTINIHLKKDTRKAAVNNQLFSWSFRSDRVLHDVSQEEVYESVAHTVVLGALDGYNGTVMCFGQTGSGKTYTMTGTNESYRHRGIIPRALQELFREVEQRVSHKITVHLSYLEIYNETLQDLLSSVRNISSGDNGGPCGMSVVEEPGGGVSVRGLSLHLVHSEEEALNLLFEGEMNRIIGAHCLNRNSSRSHCIFSIHIESRSHMLSEARYVTSKLNLVDLAGSERLGKTGSEGQVLKEAMYINKSLSFLEQAILALGDRRRDHVPFRQSKLTHALKDSLGGNCNTVLVANIYGEAAQIEETLSTLRFASRMKCVQTEPAINEHMDPMLQVKRLQKEIQLLKQELIVHDTLANRTGVSYDMLTENQVAHVQNQVRRYLDGTTDKIDIVNIRQIQEVFAQFKLAFQQQEQKVKDQVKESKTFTQTTGSTEASAKQPPGTKGTVGKLEGSSFGVGVAPLSERHSRPQSTRKNKFHKGKESSADRKEGAVSLSHGKETDTSSPGSGNAFHLSHRDLELETHSQESEGPQLGDQEHFKTESPPPKVEAFEVFKAQRGSEINYILKENKAMLLERRRQLRELTDVVNAAKREIDHIAVMLQQQREESQHQGQFMSVEGEPVMEEAELDLVLRLQELKTQYRQQYKELCSTRAEVNYCEHLVDQCRTRLLTEFESWYNESFLLPEEVQVILQAGGSIQPGLIPVEKALALEDDEQERFEHLRHELLADSPGAMSYYNAHTRTLQRKSYNRAMSQTPLQRRNTVANTRTKLPASLPVN